MPIRRSPNGARHTPPQTDPDWSRSPATGGRDQSERLVAINRNQWSQSPGARNYSHAGLMRCCIGWGLNVASRAVFRAISTKRASRPLSISMNSCSTAWRPINRWCSSMRCIRPTRCARWLQGAARHAACGRADHRPSKLEHPWRHRLGDRGDRDAGGPQGHRGELDCIACGSGSRACMETANPRFPRQCELSSRRQSAGSAPSAGTQVRAALHPAILSPPQSH